MEKKIFLLADDDNDDREMFSEALASIDDRIVCHCAADGREALNVLSKVEEKPQLIFLDVNMPVMNGWQCLKLLKEDDRYKHIPVVIISTSSYQKDMDKATELGALCYFTKPADFSELTQVLQVIVANPEAGLESAFHAIQKNLSHFIHVCREGNKQLQNKQE